jgi:dihydrolipoamide dehydrogenase
MNYDIIIIGAGPAGYAAAIRASQLGMKTALIEKDRIGGMCINWGCIPTKSIIESARNFYKAGKISEFGIDGIDNSKLKFNWKKVKSRATEISSRMSAGILSILQKNGVEIITGVAVIASDKSVIIDNRNLTAKHIIIATGSSPAEITEKFGEGYVVNMNRLFELEELPEHIVVYGKGGIAVEIAQFFNLIGKTVTIITDGQKMLPAFDERLQSYIMKKLIDDGVNVITSGKIERTEENKIFVNDKTITCDRIINCSFRNAVLPNTELNLELNDWGFIKVNDNFETSEENIFAVGDVNGKSYLAYLASAQGLWVVNKIKGLQTDFNFPNFPLNLYTVPEIAQIGMTEQQIANEGIEYKISELPFSANGKALIEGNAEGFMRLISDKKYGQVLGVQIVASNATDMIAEASAFMQVEGTIYDVALTIHAHPTISEIFTETGFDAMSKAANE